VSSAQGSLDTTELRELKDAIDKLPSIKHVASAAKLKKVHDVVVDLERRVTAVELPNPQTVGANLDATTDKRPRSIASTGRGRNAVSTGFHRCRSLCCCSLMASTHCHRAFIAASASVPDCSSRLYVLLPVPSHVALLMAAILRSVYDRKLIVGLPFH
jgi:hypothetical protein